MATFLDIATDSLTDIMQLGIGQSPSPEQTQQALRYGNRLLDSWSAKRLFLYTISTQTFPLVALLQDYSLGPSAAGPGAVVAPRPTLIESAGVTAAGGGVEMPLNLLSAPQWRAIRDKGATCSINGLPQDVWEDGLFPNTGLHFWTVPSNAATVRFGVWLQLQQFVTIFDTVNLPVGYGRAFQKALSFELCGAYQIPPPPDVVQAAQDAIQAIQAVNAQKIGGVVGESRTLMSPNLDAPGANAPLAPVPPQQQGRS